MQLKYVQGVESMSSKAGHEGNVSRNKDLQCPSLEELIDLQDGEFNKLGNSFKELGFCMTELGLCLARICDKAIGCQELERSLLESCTVKGRLIHRQTIRYEKPHTNGNVAGSCVNHSNLWQQWHYDYGIFAVLIAPWFILPCHKQTKRVNACFCTSCEQEHPSSSGHSYLEIFEPNKNNVQMVKTSSESFIVQMGESAGILSEGKLRANLHSVCRAAQVEDLSRETFVVFLQPSLSKTFSLSNYPVESSQSNGRCSAECTDKACIHEHEHGKLGQEVHEIVPPFSLRLKDGMTFAEFSRETTKQYYGRSGL